MNSEKIEVDHCSNKKCNSSKLPSFPCTGCKSAHYCSHKCRSSDKENHKNDCNVISDKEGKKEEGKEKKVCETCEYINPRFKCRYCDTRYCTKICQNIDWIHHQDVCEGHIKKIEEESKGVEKAVITSDKKYGIDASVVEEIVIFFLIKIDTILDGIMNCDKKGKFIAVITRQFHNLESGWELETIFEEGFEKSGYDVNGLDLEKNVLFVFKNFDLGNKVVGLEVNLPQLFDFKEDEALPVCDLKLNKYLLAGKEVFQKNIKGAIEKLDNKNVFSEVFNSKNRK